MNLFILRHGISVERDPVSFPDDSRRPLTLKGEERVRLICEAMQALELSFDHILSSPYLRASKTAEIVATALAHPDLGVGQFGPYLNSDTASISGQHVAEISDPLTPNYPLPSNLRHRLPNYLESAVPPLYS